MANINALLSPKLPYTPGSAGNLLRSNGTEYLNSTFTIPDTFTANGIIYASGANVLGEITTANDSVLATNGSGVPAFTSTLPNAVQLNITSVGTISTGVWGATTITVGKGGTGNTTATAYAIIAGGTTATNPFQSLATGSTGQVLQSNGASALPTFSTATYPSTATGTGTILRANGTNWVATTSTFSDTYGASTLLYSNGANTVTGLATANSASLVTNSSGVPAWSATMTDGQVITGVTSGTPIPKTIVAGTNMTITFGVSTITFDSSGGGGSGTVNAGTQGQVGYYAANGTTISGLSSSANQVLTTDGSNLSTWSSTLPSAVQGNITTVGTVTSGTWNASLITVTYGGSGRASATAYALIAGGTTSTAAHQSLATGSTGQVLQSAGNAAVPTYSTATYPSTATGTGTILRADGTNWVASTATYPNTATNSGRVLRANGTNWVESTSTFADTYSASTILYSNGANTVTGLATANSASLVTSSAGVPVWSSTMTNGQIIIGSTGATPTAATLTAGTGIGITNAAASITISVSGGGMTWTVVTGTSQAMAVNNGYVSNNAGLVTMTLPSTAAVGSLFSVVGLGAGGWKIAQNASQLIHLGNTVTTTGTGGSLASTNRYDSITVLCVVANTEFVVLNAPQSSGITVV